MSTIRESAEAYVPPQTKNIADLESVSTEVQIQHKIVKEGTPDQFEYDFIVVDEVEYRCPKSVLKQLQAQLKEKPESTEFKVNKEGEGLNTEYTVIML